MEEIILNLSHDEWIILNKLRRVVAFPESGIAMSKKGERE